MSKDLLDNRMDNNEYSIESRNKKSAKFFDNLPTLIVPEVAAKVLGKSVKTLYDWNYRGQTRKKKIPLNLFKKIGGSLYIRKDILINWVSD